MFDPMYLLLGAGLFLLVLIALGIIGIGAR